MVQALNCSLLKVNSKKYSNEANFNPALTQIPSKQTNFSSSLSANASIISGSSSRKSNPVSPNRSNQTKVLFKDHS
jgi:hypothetical protein